MTTRWVVDIDGRGGFRVAEGSHWATEAMSLEKAERALVRLREHDAARTLRTRQEAGRRLASLRHGTAA